MFIKIIQHLLIPIVATTFLASCQNVKHTANNLPTDNLLVADDYFSNTNDMHIHSIESPEQIFYLPEETKIKLHKIMAVEHSIQDKTKTVLKFIISYADKGLIYDNSATRTVSETLLYGKANCISLSVLAYSLAKEVGIEADFQEVNIPEYWTSEMNQTWFNRHVNLRLKQHRKVVDGDNVSISLNNYVVDFDPYSLKKHFKTSPINKQRIVAMFYNNKAAVAIAEKNYAQAYTYYKAAIDMDATFSGTWSNLGILYRAHNLTALAEQVYKHSLALNPSSINTMSNLAYLYQQTGEDVLANELEYKVMMARKNNPYYHLILGTEAFNLQNFNNSIKHFKIALELDPNNHEAYFGLAKSYVSLNQLTLAERYLTQAKIHTSNIQDKMRYQSKLMVLNQIAKAN